MRLLKLGLLPALLLHAQGAASLNEHLEALARTAATFAATAPGLAATETLDQRGRRGFIEVLRGNKSKIRKLDMKLPTDFRVHHVVSGFTLAALGKDGVLHETRTIRNMDGKAMTADDYPHEVLPMGPDLTDSGVKWALLQNLDRDQLEGAATDFGLVLLSFQRGLQKNYAFAAAPGRTLGDEAVDVITYRQIGGSQGLTVFRDFQEIRQPLSGEIWFVAKDLLPVRIVMSARETISKRYTVRTEATIDYAPSPFGLVPARIVHQQFLKGGAANNDLMVENDFRYADFHNGIRIP
jgi:hypothetical protein